MAATKQMMRIAAATRVKSLNLLAGLVSDAAEVGAGDEFGP